MGDSAYATKAMRGLDERVSVTSRLKSNAKLLAPKPPPALFYDVWGERPVQVVLVRGPNRKTGYDIALVSMNMNMTATAAEIIELYGQRWSIEVCI